MDIYPLAEPTSPNKINDSIGHLNKYGILCLLGEIKKYECLFKTSSSEEKQLAWNEIQKYLEHMDVKRSTVANIKMTWLDLVTKYNEWKVNPQSNSSHHCFFEKMKFLEEKGNVLGHNDSKDLHDDQHGTEVKEESITLTEAPEELHDESRFVDVKEENETIFLYYEPVEMIEYVNDEPRTVPMTRLSYEAALAHLAASTKTRICFRSAYNPNHMEHIEKILRTFAHFKDVSFVNEPSPMNAQIYNLVKMKSIEKENNKIRVHFTREFGDNESAVLIDVKSNGFNIDCQILDPECIVYPQFMDYLKEVSNKNNSVNIILDGVEFKDLFGELGWIYESYMEDNVSNGVASNIRLINDSNIYCLEYWEEVVRNLDNANDEADSDSGVSVMD